MAALARTAVGRSTSPAATACCTAASADRSADACAAGAPTVATRAASAAAIPARPHMPAQRLAPFLALSSARVRNVTPVESPAMSARTAPDLDAEAEVDLGRHA